MNKKSNETVFEKIRPYREHLVTAKEWDNYRKKHPELSLPHSSTLKYHFGSWKVIKDKFGLRHNWSTYSTEKMIQLLEPHVGALRGTPLQWDNYRKEQQLEDQLPGSSLLIIFFESWNGMKQQFDLEVKAPSRPHEYTVEEIRAMIKKYPPDIFSPRAWERYRKEHPDMKLPTYLTILRYVTKDELKEAKQNWKNNGI